MNNSDNIALANNATSKNATSNSLLIAYGHKSVELKIIKDTISMYQNSFLEKEKILKEEKQKLVIAQEIFLYIYSFYTLYILAEFAKKIPL